MGDPINRASETAFQPSTKSLILLNLNAHGHQLLLRILLPTATASLFPQPGTAAAPLLMCHDTQQGHCLRVKAVPQQDGFPKCGINSS